MWHIILALILWTSTAEAPRNLPVQPEPLPLPIPSPIVGGDVFLPMVYGVTGVTAEDGIVYGYASPHQRMYDVPFYNWQAIPAFCANAHYMPMVRRKPGEAVGDCDNGHRRLLVFNEPELGHYSASPEEAAAFLHRWAQTWAGPIACCGNFYGDGGGTLTGLEWFLAFVAAYQDAYGTPPPIDAIHMHVYEQGALDIGALQAWRKMATWGGWDIIVSESGTFPSEAYTVEEIAARLPGFLTATEDILQPAMLMWFSDYLQPWVLGRGTAWHRMNLTEIDEALTPVGAAWEAHTGQRYSEDRAK